jgi:serine protease Do
MSAPTPVRLIALAALVALTPALNAMDASSRTRAKDELKAMAAEAHRLSRAFNLIHEVAGPSVVAIHISLDAYRAFRGRILKGEVPVGEGSGFVFQSSDKGSYVVTNAHVVVQMTQAQEFITDRAGAPVPYDHITVTMNDNRTIDARFIGADVDTDVAVIRVDEPDLPAIEWADSDQARVGDWVVALGFPFGVGYSATAGIISATDRSTGIYSRENHPGFESFIQTDAAINPGNSGGPLINLDGQVVGINSNIFSKSGGSIGLGFAIPSILARRVAEDLADDGRINRPMIGIEMQPVSVDEAIKLGLPPAEVVRIARVTPGSPAEKGGAEAGDVIIAINGVRVQSLAQFRARIASCEIGVALRMKVWRQGKEKDIELVPISHLQLAKLRAEDVPDKRAFADSTVELPAWGMSVALEEGKPGALVVDVMDDREAFYAGIERGDRILREKTIGDIKSTRDLTKLAALRELWITVLKRSGESLTFHIW